MPFSVSKEKFRQGIVVYRGIRPRQEGCEYASDPGDLGRGIYYTTLRARARAVCRTNVIKAVLTLQNPLILDMSDAYDFAEKYQTVRGTREVRLRGAEQMTRDILAMGYDGLAALRTTKGQIAEVEIVDYRPYREE